MGFFTREIKRAVKANIIESQKKKAAAAHEAKKQQDEAIKRKAAIAGQASSYLVAVQEACDIVNKTTSPSVFFSKYALILENLEKLAEMGESGVYNTSSVKPRENYQRISSQFVAATNQFIDRSFAEVQEKVALVESEGAKKTLIKNYFASIEKHLGKMEAESINHLYSLKEQHTKK